MTIFTNTLVGGANADLLIGSNGNDLFYGNEGDDTLIGSDGDDLFYGWTGDDVIHGGNDNDTLSGDAGNDLLNGDAGNDLFFAGDGDDTLVGGLGYDIFNGGAGADVIRFTSRDDSASTSRDFIVNYEEADIIDLSGLGYHNITTEAGVEDGILTASFNVATNQTYISDTHSNFGFAIDGNQVATLGTDDFIFDDAPPPPITDFDIIYAPILGQSNANSMLYFHGDDESGATVLEQELTRLTDIPTASLFYSSPGNPIPLGMGGSSVDGDVATVDAARIWWYPDSNTPGAALTRAIAYMKNQLSTLETQGTVKTALTWWQGENSAWEVGFAASPQDAALRYYEATSEVFDYIKAEIGQDDMDFHIIQTPFLDLDAAAHNGTSEASVNTLNAGLTLVREQQVNLANARDDVHSSVTIDDLPTAEDTGAPESAGDLWHFAPDSYETIGARLAASIANELDISVPIDHQHIDGTAAADSLLGAEGNDTIIGQAGDDVLQGVAGEDEIYGGKGNDSISAGAGNDRVNAQWGNDTVYGGEGDDLLNGYTGNDVVYGEDGNDRVYGASGFDTLYGGAGDDVLTGYNDDDQLDGGAGRDRMHGGNGADRFVFSSREDSSYAAFDRVLDFTSGTDLVDVSALGFSGITEGRGTASVLGYQYNTTSNRTYVSDGDDFRFVLDGEFTLAASDFVF